MSTLNAKRASFFKNHEKTEKFYFTADDRAHFNEDGAIVHGKNLKQFKKLSEKVDMITRDEYNTWVKDQEGESDKPKEETAFTKPVINETDSDAVKAAKQAVLDKMEALEDAKTAQAKQPKNTGDAKKQAAADAVKTAEDELAAAVAALAETK